MKRILALALMVVPAAGEIVTIVHPAESCPPGKTMVWTAAMQAAFDRMIGAKSGMKFKKVNPDNERIHRMLAFKWNEADVLPKDGWFAIAGQSSPALAKEATDRWKTLAGPQEQGFDLNDAPANSLTAIVGISRNFEFMKAFKASDSQLPWKGGAEAVAFFGVRSTRAGEYAASVRVLAYHPANGVKALQFLAKEGDDTMILYTPDEDQTMSEAMSWIAAWRSAWNAEEKNGLTWDDRALHENDDLRIPKIDFEAKADMTRDFVGDISFEDVGLPWQVLKAEALAKLEVDETGVKFKATAEMGILPFGTMEPESKPIPRRFWFDRPFFLFLWRDQAEWPYAGVWLGDTSGFEILSP